MLHIYFIIIFISLIYLSLCFKGFTIDTQGGQVLTTKIQAQEECTSIAVTDIGTIIKYKSDSSIISHEKLINSNILSSISTYSKSFMCQYDSNKVVLTRDEIIYEITLSSNNDEDKIESISNEAQKIIYLQCDYNLKKYIITYLSEDSKNFVFKIKENTNIFSYSLTDSISYSSCVLLEESLVLCINIINSQKKLLYYYYQIQSSSKTLLNNENKEIDLTVNNFYSIQNSMIKYYSKNEIILCLMTKTALLSDISFTCFMLNVEIISQSYTLSIRSTNTPIFSFNDKINENIDYCQIDKLFNDNTYIYASICLSYYYRTTYLLSIIKYDISTDKFLIYNNNENKYKDKRFPLLSNSTISITGFNSDNSLGIFYKDIDKDSMILMFYIICEDFDRVPIGNLGTCDSYTSTTQTDYYFDECTHKFISKAGNIKEGYTIYDKNQFCKLKKIKCDDVNDYILDTFNNDGTYECWNKNSPPDKYYWDNSDNSFKKCYRSCLTCDGPGTETNNNCKSCDSNNNFFKFYYESAATFNCMHKDDLIEKHYFDRNSTSFKKCRTECLTCSEYPSGIPENDQIPEGQDTKCAKCDETNDYYPQIDKPSNCTHKNNPNIKFYYYLEAYSRWEKCTEGCKYCKENGESIYDTKCDINTIGRTDYCDKDKGYYPLVKNDDNTLNPNCFHKDKRYDRYYFDSNDNIFKKCNEACLQCDTNITCLENKCDEKNKYYPIENNPTSCLSLSQIYSYYYFDKNIKKFKRCNEACSACIEQIDVNENDTQCISCSPNYYPLEGTENKNYNKNCYHQNRKGYYKDDNIMKKCPEKCSECVSIHVTETLTDEVCTKCNNEIGFYELEGYVINNSHDYKDCRTWRAEKLLAPTDDQPPLNTILKGNIFRYCDISCTKCTDLPETKNNIKYTHCQAKECNKSAQYYYVQNHEDICAQSFPLHFLYNDPILGKYFKPCYSSCETCWKEGTKRNNNCLTCRAGYIKHPNIITNVNNCIFDCLTLNNNNYYYLDESKNDEYICVEKCPEEYPYLQPEKKQCLKSCTTESVLKYSKDRICVSACPEGTIDNIYKECVSVINECSKSDLESTLILNDINDTNINTLIVDYCHDYSFTSNQVNHITNRLKEYNIYIYKSEICLDKFYKNKMNFPDLSVCFDELKKYYGANQKQNLIVMIMNILRENAYTIVEYKIFDSINCQELYIGNCTKKNIFTNIEMNNLFSNFEISKSKIMYVDKGINVYDRDHPFFTDLCYQYTYDDDKDMILEDRVNMYYQDISKICEKECNPEADFDNKIIKCGCKLKEKFLDLNPDDSVKKWKFGINPISAEVMKCGKKAFLWDYFKKNIGNYTALVLIVAEIPVIIYFIVVGLSKVRVFLIPFMGAANPPKLSSNENKSDNSNGNNINNDDKNSNSKNNRKINEIKINTSSEEINNINNNKELSEISGLDKLDKIKTMKTIKNEQILFNDKSSDDSLLRRDLEYNDQKYVKKNYDIYKDIFDIEDLSDVELYDAVNLDKRKFCLFYYHELRNTQPIIYSFFYYTPLTPRFFKILQFIFNTTFCFFCNAFFYSKYYISRKCFKFKNTFSWYFYNIYDRIIYVILCSIIVALLLRVATSYKKKMIMWIKREKDPEVFNKEMTKMVNSMKINYIIFCSVQGAFMFLFWLYLSCFCIAYKNNEMEWFVTSWICFGLIQIWYFISTFIVTCLRFMGIKCGMESCYNLSLCLAYD